MLILFTGGGPEPKPEPEPEPQSEPDDSGDTPAE